jgi:8-oxo-dGTP pyrophosphatase MutT (NUDIX family)
LSADLRKIEQIRARSACGESRFRRRAALASLKTDSGRGEMSFVDHIRGCNSYRPWRFLPLLHAGRRVGLVRRDNADTLRRFPAVFAVVDDAVTIRGEPDFVRVSAMLDDVVKTLGDEGVVDGWRDEYFMIAPRWGDPPLFQLDRGAVAFFGTRAHGVHLNGFRRDRDGLKLWIGKRAPDKKVEPNKLDNLVAGGIGHGHGVFATLVKESAEEAGLPRDLIDRAVPVGAVTYRMETRGGLRDDVLFVYDLETPPEVTPRNTDGEITEFALMSATEVVARVRDTSDFKFNVSLVIIDFALRHGLITPDEPDYVDLVTGLRRPFDRT